MYAIAIFAAMFLAQGVVAQPFDVGVIHGTVIDRDGHPARNIGLATRPLGVAFGGIVPQTRTTADGKFRFALPWWGRYTVYADDEEAGYSQFSTGPSLNSGPTQVKLSEVTISSRQPEVCFNFVLPPKAGFLDIHLTNKRTGEVIRDLDVEIQPVPPDGSFSSGRSDSKLPVLVPPGKPLLIHVRATGFQEWSKSLGDGLLIRVESGHRLPLDVRLVPSS